MIGVALAVEVDMCPRSISLTLLSVVHAGYSRTSHDELKGDIKRYEEAVELLSSHRDAHPPTGPAMTENPALG